MLPRFPSDATRAMLRAHPIVTMLVHPEDLPPAGLVALKTLLFRVPVNVLA